MNNHSFKCTKSNHPPANPSTLYQTNLKKIPIYRTHSFFYPNLSFYSIYILRDCITSFKISYEIALAKKKQTGNINVVKKHPT